MDDSLFAVIVTGVTICILTCLVWNSDVGEMVKTGRLLHAGKVYEVRILENDSP